MKKNFKFIIKMLLFILFIIVLIFSIFLFGFNDRKRSNDIDYEKIPIFNKLVAEMQNIDPSYKVEKSVLYYQNKPPNNLQIFISSDNTNYNQIKEEIYNSSLILISEEFSNDLLQNTNKISDVTGIEFQLYKLNKNIVVGYLSGDTTIDLKGDKVPQLTLFIKDIESDKKLIFEVFLYRNEFFDINTNKPLDWEEILL